MSAPENLERDEQKQVAMSLFSEYNRFQAARAGREEVWKQCEAVYLGTPAAIDYMRTHVGRIVGDVNDDWRHRIQVSKGYEIVETIVSYLMGAFFPNKDWFSYIPHEPNIQDLVDVVKKFTMAKLRDASFESKWEMYTRQCVITGFSPMLITWDRRMEYRYKRVLQNVTQTDALGEVKRTTQWVPRREHRLIKNNVNFEPLSCYDVYIDPQKDNLMDSGVFRVIRKTKGEIARQITRGDYPYLDMAHVAKWKAQTVQTVKKQAVATWMGVNYYPMDLVEMVEYWGDIEVQDKVYEDVHAVFLGNELAKFEPNGYWCGKPFIIGNAIPIANQVYGLGVLEPVLGMLHQLNIVTNQRLDALELAIDPMYKVVNDGFTDLDDIYTAPGKLLITGATDNIIPLQKDTTFQVSYTESQVLEQNIDQSVGTGAYIGTQQGRSGERVTATEIQAVRDAGGNRLSSIHRHIENTQLMPLLQKLYILFQQFVEEDEVVRVPGGGGYEYVQVGAAELSHQFDVYPVGADHVAQEEKDLQMIMDFVAMVSQVPMWAEMVNWEALLEEVVRKFGFDPDVAQLIVSPPEPEPEQQAPMSPGEDALQSAHAMAGKPGEDVMAAQMMMQGENTAAAMHQANLGGQDPEAAAMMGQMLDQQVQQA
jgi:hypothetical protein